MTITLTDTLLLVGSLSILMVNYANRRVATASAARTLTTDHMKGARRHGHAKTLQILRKRLSLDTGMLAFAALGGVLGLFAAVCVLVQWELLAGEIFIGGLASGVISLLLSLRESMISNSSHFGELDNTVAKDEPWNATAP